MDKQIESKIMTMLPLLNEKQSRIYLATEAIALGRGGVKEISKLTGVSQTTIIKGKKEIKSDELFNNAGIRNVGGGRKKNRRNSKRNIGSN